MTSSHVFSNRHILVLIHQITSYMLWKMSTANLTTQQQKNNKNNNNKTKSNMWWGTICCEAAEHATAFSVRNTGNLAYFNEQTLLCITAFYRCLDQFFKVILPWLLRIWHCNRLLNSLNFWQEHSRQKIVVTFVL